MFWGFDNIITQFFVVDENNILLKDFAQCLKVNMKSLVKILSVLLLNISWHRNTVYSKRNYVTFSFRENQNSQIILAVLNFSQKNYIMLCLQSYAKNLMLA